MAKKKEITVDDLPEIERLSGLGLNEDHIAAFLGMSAGTWYIRKSEMPEINESLKKGRSKGIEEVAGLLLQNCRAGNVPSQIFFMKCKGKWTENNTTEITIKTAELDKMSIDERIALVKGWTPQQMITLLTPAIKEASQKAVEQGITDGHQGASES